MREYFAAFALAVVTAVAAPPQTDEWQQQINQGAVAETLGEYTAAAAAYQVAARISDGFDHTDKRRAVTWNILGTVYDALGRFADAEGAYRRGLKEAAASGGKSSAQYALVLGNLGAVYAETGQIAAGEKLLREAVAIHAVTDPPDELHAAIAQNALAEVLTAAAKYKEADSLLSKALPVLEKHPNAGAEAAIANHNLALARFCQNNYEDARRLFQHALTMIEHRWGPDHPLLIRTLNGQALLAARTGRREEACEKLRRALDLAEKRLGPDHPVYATLLGNYASLLRQGGDKSQAKVLETRSSQILKDSGRRNGTGAVVDIRSLQAK